MCKQYPHPHPTPTPTPPPHPAPHPTLPNPSVLKIRMRLGLFDPIENQPYWHTPPSAINSAASQASNLLATQSSMVLLKNDGATLPFPKGKKIAVIGPHANATLALVGNYVSFLLYIYLLIIICVYPRP